MSKSYRLGVAVLAVAIVCAMTDARSAFGQRLRIGGNSNQGNNDKKDKDKDDDKDRKKDRDKNDQKNQGNQGGQGNQNSQGQGGNSNDSKKSGQPSQAELQDMLKKKQQDFQDRFNQVQGGNKGPNLQGPGNPNFGGNNNKPGGPGQQFPQSQQNQKFKDFKFDDDDHDHNYKKMNFGSWRGDKWEGSNKVGDWAHAFGYKKTSIFGDKWYRDHPQAWRYDNNRANIWVTGTVPGVYSWLGWGAIPQQYQVYYGNSPKFDPSRFGEWYPLGVFSLMSSPDDMGTRIVQLAVDRNGRLAGTYFDMISDTENSIVGEINRQTQRAEWSLRRNPDVTFRASIYRLLQPSGYVTVRLPQGDQRWQFVRLEN